MKIFLLIIFLLFTNIGCVSLTQTKEPPQIELDPRIIADCREVRMLTIGIANYRNSDMSREYTIHVYTQAAQNINNDPKRKNKILTTDVLEVLFIIEWVYSNPKMTVDQIDDAVIKSCLEFYGILPKHND